MIHPWPKVEGFSFRNQMQLFFNIVPSCINTFSPAVMEQTDPFCVDGAILGPQKVVYSIHHIIISGKRMTTKFLFHFWEEVIVRESQIKRIGWVFVQQVGIHISGCVWWTIPWLSTSNLLDFSLVVVSEDQHRTPTALLHSKK